MLCAEETAVSSKGRRICLAGAPVKDVSKGQVGQHDVIFVQFDVIVLDGAQDCSPSIQHALVCQQHSLHQGTESCKFCQCTS